MLYVVVRFGASKLSLWCRYHASHSMPSTTVLYVPKERRGVWAESLYGRRVAAADDGAGDGASDSPAEEREQPCSSDDTRHAKAAREPPSPVDGPHASPSTVLAARVGIHASRGEAPPGEVRREVREHLSGQMTGTNGAVSRRAPPAPQHPGHRP